MVSTMDTSGGVDGDTPDSRLQSSLAAAASQLRNLVEAKKSRQAEYGIADDTAEPFNLDSSDIFPTEKTTIQSQNRILGVGNQIMPSSLFTPKGTQVWKVGEQERSKPNYSTGWLENTCTNTNLSLPDSVHFKKDSKSLMSAVRQTMMAYYPEDASVIESIAEKQEEDNWDGICTTGFSLDGVPQHQPQLTPIIPDDPLSILARLPTHCKLDINKDAPEGIPKFRVTYSVFGENIEGFGKDKHSAKIDGCMKMMYMFQHVLDVPEFDVAFWHPLPDKKFPKQRASAERQMLNAVRCKMEKAEPDEVEIAPRLYQASTKIEGLTIQAQGYSKKTAKRRLYLFLMLLMPNQLNKLVDTTKWMGDGAAYAPDATYGTTDSQRGKKRPLEGDFTVDQVGGKARNIGDGEPSLQPVKLVEAENEDELRLMIQKHIATPKPDGASFPMNLSNRKCFMHILNHRCGKAAKFERSNQKVNNQFQTILTLADDSQFQGMGKTVDMAKHQAVMRAFKENGTLAQREPMMFFGICTFSLMNEIARNLRVTVSQANNMYTTSIAVLHKEKQTIYTKNDFTKKGSQRLTALQFLETFSPLTQKVLKLAKEIAKQKQNEISPAALMVNKRKLLNNVFVTFGQKRPTTDDSGLFNFKIYGKSFSIQSTNDLEQDTQNIYDEIQTSFPFLLERKNLIDETSSNSSSNSGRCPIAELASRLSLNSELKKLGHEIMHWKIEHYDPEIKYFRVSMTLPSQDRYVGCGTNLTYAQKDAALQCLRHHPVIGHGDGSHNLRNYWNELQQRLKGTDCELHSEVISGDANCPKTMYCRVKVYATQETPEKKKLFESSATGISLAHAQRRAAHKLLDEPTYGGKICTKALADRKIVISWDKAMEDATSKMVLKKSQLTYTNATTSDGEEATKQVFEGEGTSSRQARQRAAYMFLKANYGPDAANTQPKEITSIKQVKPYNVKGNLDPPLPPIALERGSKDDENMPDLNEERKKKYEAMLVRNSKYREKKDTKQEEEGVLKQEDVEMEEAPEDSIAINDESENVAIPDEIEEPVQEPEIKEEPATPSPKKRGGASRGRRGRKRGAKS